MRLIFLPFLCAIVGFAGATSARATVQDDIAGQVVARVAGSEYILPMLDSDISVSVEGDMATVEITQTFLNEAPSARRGGISVPFEPNSSRLRHGNGCRGMRLSQPSFRKKPRPKPPFRQQPMRVRRQPF